MIKTKKNLSTVIGKDEIVHQVAAKAGLPLVKTAELIDAFTQVVQDNLANGCGVRLMGFGTWDVRHVAGRRVKSIRDGEEITIPANTRIGFRAGAVLAQAAHTRRYR